MLHGQVRWHPRQDRRKATLIIDILSCILLQRELTLQRELNDKKERGAKEGAGKGDVNLEKTLFTTFH